MGCWRTRRDVEWLVMRGVYCVIASRGGCGSFSGGLSEFERDQLVLLDELCGPESGWMNYG